MDLPKVLSLSTHADLGRLRDRAKVLEDNGFDVMSVTTAWRAMFEIMSGHYGIFVSCPLLSDFSTADLFKLFKQYSPDGLSVFMIRDEIRSSVYRQQADIQVHESYGPEGIAAAILAHLKPTEGTDFADTA
jgi:hypothetical protein